jgi:hypothetical protein
MTTADAERLQALRSSLAADGYSLELTERDERIGAVITAGPGTCEDCLVPKDLMRAILGQALGIDGETIDLTYPSEVGGDRGQPS